MTTTLPDAHCRWPGPAAAAEPMPSIRAAGAAKARRARSVAAERERVNDSHRRAGDEGHSAQPKLIWVELADSTLGFQAGGLDRPARRLALERRQLYSRQRAGQSATHQRPVGERSRHGRSRRFAFVPRIRRSPASGGRSSTSQATGDMVVIRKTSMRPVEEGDETSTVTEIALDQLEGTVLDVGPESVQFEFDGEKIDVRREKLEGLVYLPASSPRVLAAGLPAGRCRRLDLALESLELAEGPPAAPAPSAARRRLPARRDRQARLLHRQRRFPLGSGAGHGRRRRGRQPAAGGDDVQVRPRVRRADRPAARSRLGSRSTDRRSTTACRCTARPRWSIACRKASAGCAPWPASMIR